MVHMTEKDFPRCPCPMTTTSRGWGIVLQDEAEGAASQGSTSAQTLPPAQTPVNPRFAMHQKWGSANFQKIIVKEKQPQDVGRG